MSIRDEVHEEPKGYLIGAPEEFTTQLRELLDEMLWSRSPTAIKSRLPALVRLTERLILASSWGGGHVQANATLNRPIASRVTARGSI